MRKIISIGILILTSILIQYHAQISKPKSIDIKDVKFSGSTKINSFAKFPVIEKVTKASDNTILRTKFYLKGSNGYSLRPLSNSGTEPKTKETKVSEEKGNGWLCQTNKIKVSLEDDSFMNTYNVQKNTKIVPGAVYTFNSFYDGEFKEETSPRNTIRVSSFDSGIDGDIFEYVENPTTIDNYNALNRIKNRTAINKNNAGYKSKVYMTSSEAEMLTAIGFGASGYGAKLNVGFQRKATEYERYFMIDATQEMFAQIAEMPTNGVFKNPEDNKKEGLMFLQSVTYGMRVLVSVKMSFQSKESADELMAKYEGFGFGASADLKMIDKNVNSSTEIKMYIVGGTNSGFVVQDVTSVTSALNTAFKDLTNKTAAPIYFTFVNMNNEVIKTSSATDEFAVRQCIPVAPDAPDENLRFYDVSVALNQIEESHKPNDEKSIGVRIDAGLFVDGTQRTFDDQKQNKFYDPLLYVGDREGLNPKEMTNKWGRPDNGKLNFKAAAYKSLGSGKSFNAKLTRDDIVNGNAMIRVNIPILADYMGKDDWSFYDKMKKEINLKEIIDSGKTSFKITINHNDGKTYVFNFEVTARMTQQFAEPKKTTIVRDVMKDSRIKVTSDKLDNVKRKLIKK